MTSDEINQMTETQALIKLIEMGQEEYKKGAYQSADDFFNEMKSDENFHLKQAKKNDLSHKQS